MTKSHTPGPWHTGGYGSRIIYDERGWAIADAKVFHGNQRSGEDVANATLIAAAPDLYEALQDALTDGGVIGWEDRAQAALSKARGQS